MTTDNPIQVRTIIEEDYHDWKKLWISYLDFYQTCLSDTVTDNTFKQLLVSNSSPYGLVATDSSEKIIGFVHYLFHVTTWAIEPACYLQDLFVLPAMKGKNVGAQLMKAVNEESEKKNGSLLHWLTAHDNIPARALYDKIGSVTPLIRYKWKQ